MPGLDVVCNTRGVVFTRTECTVCVRAPVSGIVNGNEGMQHGIDELLDYLKVRIV